MKKRIEFTDEQYYAVVNRMAERQIKNPKITVSTHCSDIISFKLEKAEYKKVIFLSYEEAKSFANSLQHSITELESSAESNKKFTY